MRMKDKDKYFDVKKNSKNNKLISLFHLINF